MNWKKIYEEHYGKVPDGYQVHHIIPRYAGGDDSIDNLIALSKEDHMKAHMNRYEEFGDFRDLCAYHLIANNFEDVKYINSSEGGKIGGKIVYESGIGIFRSEEDRVKWASMGGKKGGKIQKKLGLGIHTANTDQRLIWASMGGNASGQFKKKEFQSEMGKRGGAKNKGFSWYTTTEGKQMKYTAKQKLIESFDKFIARTKYQRGRI